MARERNVRVGILEDRHRASFHTGSQWSRRRVFSKEGNCSHEAGNVRQAIRIHELGKDHAAADAQSR